MGMGLEEACEEFAEMKEKAKKQFSALWDSA